MKIGLQFIAVFPCPGYIFYTCAEILSLYGGHYEACVVPFPRFFCCDFFVRKSRSFGVFPSRS